MKSYTDLEQSKKLAEILPIESADMFWLVLGNTSRVHVLTEPLSNYSRWESYPCWSLAALLEILPVDWWGYNKHYFLEISKMGDNTKPYEIRYYRFKEDWEGANFGRITHIAYQADNPIDACVEMIEKLHKQKLL